MMNAKHVALAAALGLAPFCALPLCAQTPPADEAVVPQDVVPPEVVASAVASVTRLGEEVVLGRYQVALDRMNPEWKQRAAQSVGGMQALERKIESIPAEMVRQGISMISFKPQGQPLVHQVAPGRRVTAAGESFGYTKWLVLVPTTTCYRLLTRVEGGPPRTLMIERTGFQVAVSSKDKLDWTFIDGSGLKPGDLRGLFPTLPLDMKMPPVGERQIR